MAAESDVLRAAIEKDDVASVKRLIADRSEILLEKVGDAGQSLLHIAAAADARQVTEAFLAAGADFYSRDGNGQLPLDIPPGEALNDTRKWLRQVNASRNAFLRAVHGEKIEEVKQRLAADPALARSRDIGDGWSAVMTACHQGNAELLKLLLAAGAEVNAADFHTQHDAIYVCAEKGQAACLRLLLEAGANPRKTWRVAYGNLPMEMNALHVASWKGHPEIVTILLHAGVDANTRARSYAMFSPLHLAASDGHAEVIKALLASGSDVAARDGRRGITALDMATAGKHQAAITLLAGQ